MHRSVPKLVFYCYGQAGSLAIYKCQTMLLLLQVYLKFSITLQIFIGVSWSTHISLHQADDFPFLQVVGEVTFQQKQLGSLKFCCLFL